MNCFFRPFKNTSYLLIALLLFAGGFRFAYSAEHQASNVGNEPVQAKKQITIIAQHFSSHFSSIAKSLSLSSLSDTHRVVNMSLADWKMQQPESALIISLGRSPLEELVKTEHQEPILAAVITYQDFREIVKQETTPNALSAIFYDPDPLRQIVLGKLLLPLSDSVGVMHSMETPFFIEEYQTITEALDLSLNAIPLRQTTEVAIQFPRLVQKADFIIAQPDPVIYNSQTLPRVLLTSYRQRKVVIGYSTGVVKAGAVATTYTTAEMLIDDLEESAVEILSNKKTSFTRHSKYYDISYNLEVANSLGLDIVSKEELQAKIEKLQQETLNESDSQ